MTPEQMEMNTGPRAIAFLDAIERVCREHGLSISHEDQHGAFQVVPFNEDDLEWLRDYYGIRR